MILFLVIYQETNFWSATKDCSRVVHFFLKIFLHHKDKNTILIKYYKEMNLQIDFTFEEICL